MAVFNTLGFRLTSGPHHLGLGAVSLVYLVYVLGTLSSAVSGRLADRFGRRAILPSGCVLAIAGLAAHPVALAPRHRCRARRTDSWFLRGPRAGERLGRRARTPRRRERQPSRSVLPVRVLRRVFSLRQSRQQRVGHGRLAGRQHTGTGPAAGLRLAGAHAPSNPRPRAQSPADGVSVTRERRDDFRDLRRSARVHREADREDGGMGELHVNMNSRSTA